VAEVMEECSGHSPDRLMAATDAFATTMRALVPSGWHNPMFLVWLVLARLTRLAPEQLGQIRGTAALRWQVDGQAHGPRTLRLTNGVPLHPLGTGIFPFTS
jgi:hypothetical protein